MFFQPINETDELFITNAFTDCIQYSKALRVIVDAFYARDGKIMLNSEKHMYTVFAYLMLLAYEDVGSNWFNKCVLSHHTKKMHTVSKYRRYKVFSIEYTYHINNFLFALKSATFFHVSVFTVRN